MTVLERALELAELYYSSDIDNSLDAELAMLEAENYILGGTEDVALN